MIRPSSTAASNARSRPPLRPHTASSDSSDNSTGKGKRRTRLARRLRKTMTKEERWLWSRISNRQLGGAKFRRQTPIGRYIVDFVCFERKLIVELDGGHHGYACQKEHDRSRDAWLRSQGFVALRVWNLDVMRDPDSVLATVFGALERKRND